MSLLGNDVKVPEKIQMTEIWFHSSLNNRIFYNTINWCTFNYTIVSWFQIEVDASIRPQLIEPLTVTKVVQIIKCTYTVFIDNFINISTNTSIYVSICRRRYDRYVRLKRNDPMCDPWDSQGNDKMQFLFLLLFALIF